MQLGNGTARTRNEKGMRGGLLNKRPKEEKVSGFRMGGREHGGGGCLWGGDQFCLAL